MSIVWSHTPSLPWGLQAKPGNFWSEEQSCPSHALYRRIHEVKRPIQCVEPPIHPSEIMPAATYARLRDSYRRTMMAYKRPRRIGLGEQLTLLFENRDTVLFHIHEILHIEGNWSPDRIQLELETYRPLMPKKGALSATVMLSRGDAQFAQDFHQRLFEQRALEFRLGARRFPAIPTEPEVMDGEPVRYLRFEFGYLSDILMAPDLKLVFQGPDTDVSVSLPPEARTALQHDLWN